MSNFRRLQIIYAACHLLIPVAILFGNLNWWLWALACYLVLQILGVGVGMHRLLAHRAFETSAIEFNILTLLGTLSCMGSPLSWAGIHRLHHVTADGPRDPHDPRHLGAWGILSGAYNRELRLPRSMIRDFVMSRWLLWMHRNYFSILAVYAAVLLVLSWRLFLFQFAMPVVLVYWANALGIFLNHTWGYRNFETDDRSVNSWLLSLYTLGDGWHNNHHHQPSQYDHRVRWWEWDSCALLIRYVFKKG